MAETTESNGAKIQDRIGLLRPPNCIVHDEANRYLDWASQFGKVKLLMLDSSFEDIDLLIIPDYGVNWSRFPAFTQVKSSVYNTVSFDYYTLVAEKLSNIKDLPIIYLGFSGVDRLIMEGASFHFNKSIRKPKKYKVEYVTNTKAERWTTMGIDYIRFKEYPSPIWKPNCVVEPSKHRRPDEKELPLIWTYDKITIILYNPVYYQILPDSHLDRVTGNKLGDYPSFIEMVDSIGMSQMIKKCQKDSELESS